VVKTLQVAALVGEATLRFVLKTNVDKCAPMTVFLTGFFDFCPHFLCGQGVGFHSSCEQRVDSIGVALLLMPVRFSAG
jgi:hypothetical protein